jgi:hypothetical protein
MRCLCETSTVLRLYIAYSVICILSLLRMDLYLGVVPVILDGDLFNLTSCQAYYTRDDCQRLCSAFICLAKATKASFTDQ